MGRLHSEWNSTMMSILSPTALRILRERLERRASSSAGEMSGRRVRSAAMIERPDLHAGDALLEQRVGEFVGAVQEAVEVLVGPACSPTPQLATGLAAARRGCSGSRRRCCRCGCDRATCRPAAVADRLADRLAEEVPQRDVDGGVAARLHARAERQPR